MHKDAMIRPPQITNWELGNEIMHHVCDELADLEVECKISHPEISKILHKTRLSLGPIVNDLMKDNMAPEPQHGEGT
jgi:hypothetical protein